MDDQEKLYKAGFNSGYLLAKYEPELATKILDSVKGQYNSDYCSGLTVGHDTYILEEIEKQHHGKDKSPNNTPNKDKDDKERER